MEAERQWPFRPWVVDDVAGAKLWEIKNAVKHKMAYCGNRETAELIAEAVNAARR